MKVSFFGENMIPYKFYMCLEVFVPRIFVFYEEDKETNHPIKKYHVPMLNFSIKEFLFLMGIESLIYKYKLRY